ncbi:threonine/homoserine/homoserine lactone efflux protein [Stella humosa]|uniref:Threonine/homoserine/homoserine lactone efflux protein n=1 Tax=Stella humosa TaxID=94 RepID=A0A3N1KSH2_9PROT|nr:threonine/homoserine/homoserine lactone efflux protein [Stella humosa]BBK33196.1 lysine transporter LysE [Stella humosa]
MLLVVSYALGHGRRSAAATVAGVALGDTTAVIASLLGLGALLAASAMLFTVLKWVGAAYLVYLGVKLWRAPVSANGIPAAPPAPPWKIFLHAYGVTALNPKGIVFFVAFLPQFVDRGGDVAWQLLILGSSFVVIATVNALAYALLAAGARRAVRRPSVQRAVNRTGGGLLVGAGLLTALWGRPA